MQLRLLVHEMHTPMLLEGTVLVLPKKRQPQHCVLELPASVITFLTSPVPAGRCETRRARAVCPAEQPPASSSAGGCRGMLGDRHRHIGPEWCRRGPSCRKTFKANLVSTGLRHVFLLNRHWLTAHISSFGRIHRKMCDFTENWSLISRTMLDKSNTTAL